MRQFISVLLLLVTLPLAAMAVQPDEVLGDPALEARARGISQKLRCPVCQGENIDESNAAISRDLRLYVRERLVAGDDDEEVIDAVVDRFGEFVLFEPRAVVATCCCGWPGDHGHSCADRGLAVHPVAIHDHTTDHPAFR